MLQLNNPLQMQSLTINSVITTLMPDETSEYETIGITFSNGSYILLRANNTWTGAGYNSMKEPCIEVLSQTSDLDKSLVDLGIITEEQHLKAVEEDDFLFKQRMEAQEQQREIAVRNAELKQLEQLKLKYGK